MSIIEKVFHYEENKISVIKCNDEIWFSVSQNGVHLRLGVTQNGVHLNLQLGCLFINESGLYSLILR